MSVKLVFLHASLAQAQLFVHIVFMAKFYRQIYLAKIIVLLVFIINLTFVLLVQLIARLVRLLDVLHAIL